MEKKRYFFGMLVIALVFGMLVVGCDDGSSSSGSSKKSTYYYEAFKITKAQYDTFMDSVTPDYNYTFSEIKGFRQTLRNYNGTFLQSGTGVSETELKDFMTSSGISTSEYQTIKQSLNSVGNLIYFFRHQSGDIIWIYFEKE